MPNVQGLTFPDVPELDWMPHARNSLESMRGGSTYADKLHLAWKFLFWSRRQCLIPRSAPEWDVAYAFTVKYHRLLFGMELLPEEEKLIARATEQYKKRKK